MMGEWLIKRGNDCRYEDCCLLYINKIVHIVVVINTITLLLHFMDTDAIIRTQKFSI